MQMFPRELGKLLAGGRETNGLAHLAFQFGVKKFLKLRNLPADEALARVIIRRGVGDALRRHPPPQAR
jgi:NAD-dependent oxidoreductase involved in siderophore biosynthesis